MVDDSDIIFMWYIYMIFIYWTYGFQPTQCAVTEAHGDDRVLCYWGTKAHDGEAIEVSWYKIIVWVLHGTMVEHVWVNIFQP